MKKLDLQNYRLMYPLFQAVGVVLFFLIAGFLAFELGIFPREPIEQLMSQLPLPVEIWHTDEAPVTMDIMESCEEDSDCTIVEFTDCCGQSPKAINKKYVHTYQANPHFHQAANLDQCDNDPAIFCAERSPDPQPKCIQSGSFKRCKL